MRKYETVMAIDSLLKAEEIESIVKKYEKFISANGGVIENVDHWGKKRLAYEIKKRQYGYYVCMHYEAPATLLKQLDREVHLNESMLRYKTFVLDKKALSALEAKPVFKQEEAREEKPAPAPVEEKPVEAAANEATPAAEESAPVEPAAEEETPKTEE